jgi:ketosteroid isomerase-like protein
MATKKARTTEEVLGHHVQALVSRDLDAVVSDYAEDAVVFLPNGAFKGHEGIRACFTGIMQALTPDMVKNMKVIKQAIDGGYAYVCWSSSPAIPFAGDTFCVTDGKIVMQSFVGQLA